MPMKTAVVTEYNLSRKSDIKMKKYIMALDAGTTSNRCILFDKKGQICSVSQREFAQIYPHSGWVEHDPYEIFNVMLGIARDAMQRIGAGPDDIASIGITNQRETTVVWDKNTSQPVYNAIVWQCRRTAQECSELEKQGWSEVIQQKTGLKLDPYFSASKIKWILDNVEGAREKAENGDLLMGTIETWIIWKLTGGRVHITDYTNASRTMLFNIYDLKWDEELLDLFKIPETILPQVKGCSEIYGYTDMEFFGKEIAIAGAAGDQQSALFGQQCFEPGMVKNTYGTGGFLLMNTGSKPISSANGLVTTIGWSINGEITYALEGSVMIAGAVIQWLRDELHLIDSAADTEYLASKVTDTNGAYLVPAFAGLGAPYWNPYARGVFIGLSRGVNKSHMVRAALESMAFQANDVIRAMCADSGIEMNTIRIDGGASANNLLAQMQADFSNISVVRPACVETTAMGAAYMAGLAVGFWDSIENICQNTHEDVIFKPLMDHDERERKLTEWKKAVSCANYLTTL